MIAMFVYYTVKLFVWLTVVCLVATLIMIGLIFAGVTLIVREFGKIKRKAVT